MFGGGTAAHFPPKKNESATPSTWCPRTAESHPPRLRGGATAAEEKYSAFWFYGKRGAGSYSVADCSVHVLELPVCGDGSSISHTPPVGR